MDPFTISMAVAPMLVSSAKLAIIVNSVKDSYKNAPATLTSTITECKLMHVALCKIQGLVYRNETELHWQLKSQKNLQEAFDSALTGCRLTLAALTLEVSKLVEPKRQENPGGENIDMDFQTKVQLVWKEDVMKNLLDHTRGQMTSLHFLITILESETQVEILKQLRQNTAAIHKILQRAKSIRTVQGFDDAESSFHSTQLFATSGPDPSHEEKLNQSSVYQKARTAAAEELLARKIELLEEKYKLEEKLEDLRLEVALKDETVTELEHKISLKDRDMALKSNRIAALEREVFMRAHDMNPNSVILEKLKSEISSKDGDISEPLRQSQPAAESTDRVQQSFEQILRSPHKVFKINRTGQIFI